MPEQQILIDSAAAAARLGVGAGTLAKWRISGTGPQFIKLGTRVRYTEADIDEWIIAQRRRSTADPGPAAVTRAPPERATPPIAARHG